MDPELFWTSELRLKLIAKLCNRIFHAQLQGAQLSTLYYDLRYVELLVTTNAVFLEANRANF